MSRPLCHQKAPALGCRVQGQKPYTLNPKVRGLHKCVTLVEDVKEPQELIEGFGSLRPGRFGGLCRDLVVLEQVQTSLSKGLGVPYAVLRMRSRMCKVKTLVVWELPGYFVCERRQKGHRSHLVATENFQNELLSVVVR